MRKKFISHPDLQDLISGKKKNCQDPTFLFIFLGIHHGPSTRKHSKPFNMVATNKNAWEEPQGFCAIHYSRRINNCI